MPSEPIRVLLVDDDAVFARIIERALSQESTDRFTIVHRDLLRDALEYVRMAEADAVLLDLMLPDSDGLETVQTLARAAPRLPIVVLTGLDDDRTAVQALRAGAQDYISKSNIDPDSLTRALRHAVERKRTEQRLRESEARIRAVLETAVDPILTFNKAGQIETVNPACETLFGYQSTELIGTNVFHLLDGPFRRQEEDRFTASLRVAGAAGLGTHQEVVGQRKNGTTFPLDFVISEVGLDERRLFTILIRDLTERRQAVAARLRLEARLQHAQKMESLSVLAGGIAHQFNNLLQAILGNVDLALMELPADARVRPFLHEAEAATLRAAELSKHMLAYSGKGRFVVLAASLNEIVEQTTDLLQILAVPRAKLVFDLAPELPLVEVDAEQIKQALVNLVANAAEAIDTPPGIIQVRTGTVHLEQQVAGQALFEEDLADGNYVYLEVADNGHGMDEATKAKIFDPFFTTKFPGRGLGLAAVQGIVSGHGGAIRVSSRPHEGATFTLLFPSARSAAPSPSPPEQPTRATILVIDDKPTNQAVARGILERHGYQVLTAASGAEGLAVAQAHSDGIGAVILDAVLPAMSGTNTYQLLRQRQPDMPILCCSGQNAHTAGGVQRTDRVSFLQKPYTSRELVAALEQLLP